MKKIVSIILVVMMILSVPVTFAGAYADEPDYSGKTVVLYTGNLRGDVDSYAKIKTVKDAYEAKGADVILVDAGNYLQGSTYANSDRGLSVYNLMDSVGYDVAAMGQYEFVYGDATVGYIYHSNLYRYYTQAELTDGAEELEYGVNRDGSMTETRPQKNPAAFDVISSNVIGTADYYSFDVSTVVTTDSGINIGFFALTDIDTVGNVQDIFVDGLTFGDAAATANVQLAALEGNDIVCCLSNVDTADYGDITIIAETDGAAVAGAYIVDNSTKVVTHESVNLTGVAADASIATEIAAVKAAANPVLATSTVTLDGADSTNWNGETNLGDLVTDALKWYAEEYMDVRDGVEIVVIQNGGNCDQFIYSGDVIETDLLKSFPFSPNGVALLYVTGEQLLEALESGTQKEDCPAWPQVSGINYTVNTAMEYDAGEAYGNFFVADSINRVTINSINGKAFDPVATYALVADNFVIRGGDTYYTFKEIYDAGKDDSSIYLNDSALVRNVLAAYIKDSLGGKIGGAYAAPQGRATLINTPEEPLPFVDVADGEWFYDAVKYAYKNKLFNGTTPTTFSPDAIMNRAMMVTVLYRLDGQPDASAYENPFDDVANGEWYTDAIRWAAANNIVTGIDDTTFNPMGDITREQMVTILYRYHVRYKGNVVNQKEDALDGFTDADTVSSYALDAMRWAVDLGIIKGVTDTTLAPAGSSSRAQVATVFMRYEK